MQKQKQILTKRYDSQHPRPHQMRREISRTRISFYANAVHASNQPAPKYRIPLRFYWSFIRAFAVIIVFVFIASHVVNSQHAAAENASQKAQASAIAAAKESAFLSQVHTMLADNDRVTTEVAIALPGRPVRTEGANTPFDGASTAKLLTAADYLHKVDTHKASLTQNIAGQPARDLLERMIVDSDDTAWEDLNGYLGHKDLLHYANSVGFDAYNPNTNTFPASSVAMLLQSLYGGELLSDSSRSTLLGYMKRANHTEFMMSGLSPSVTTYHKIGIDEDTVNDALLIQKGDAWAVVVVFTDGHGTYDWNDRALFLQQIAANAEQSLL